MDEDLDRGQIISAEIGRYLTEMGVDVGLLGLLASAGGDDMYVLTFSELGALRVTNEGRERPDWSVRIIDGGLYLRGTQNSMYGEGKYMLLCEQGSVTLYSVYEAGLEKARSIVENSWVHSMLIDGHSVPLGDHFQLFSDGSYLNSMFSLSSEHLTRITDARESVGHAMQVSIESPFFVGYRVDITADGRAMMSQFVRSCVSGDYGDLAE